MYAHRYNQIVNLCYSYKTVGLGGSEIERQRFLGKYLEVLQINS
jgi:hypothetical protein